MNTQSETRILDSLEIMGNPDLFIWEASSPLPEGEGGGGVAVNLGHN